MILEVCAGSYSDCVNAYRGGATRVELNSALSLGGLTPSVATLRNVKREMSLEVACMVRNRAAGFCYSNREKIVMLEDTKILLENGADAIVFGCLTKNREVDVEFVRKMVTVIHSFNKKAVFHKAIDVCENYTSSIEKLIECHVDRVLTSAQKRTVLEAKEEIKYIIDTYGEKIEILPGGSINIDNVSEIVNYTHTNQIHSSCKDFHQDHTTSYGVISYSYLDGTDNYECVSLVKVKELKKRLDNLKNRKM